MNMEERDKIKDLLKVLSEKLKKPENKDLLDEFLLNCGVFEVEGISDSAFVRLQRQVLRQKSRVYYKNVKNIKLQTELIDAHSQMLWYKTINELERYFLYVNYQVENMLNYYIRENDAFTKINQSAGTYHTILKPSSNNGKTFQREIDCFQFFFNKEQKPNKVSSIGSLWAKLLFWSIDKLGNDRFLTEQYWNLSAIIDIRNEQNHADYERQSNKCKWWYEQEDGFSLAFIEAILKTIRNSIL